MIILHIVLLSIAPISELRGAIPYAIANGIQPLEATIISIIANAMIIPVLVYVVKPIFSYIKRISFVHPYVEAYEKRAVSKVARHSRSRFWAIVLLVGIPIPTTGVYTGVTAGLLLKMKVREILLANTIGVLISGTIVFLISIGVLHM